MTFQKTEFGVEKEKNGLKNGGDGYLFHRKPKSVIINS
jgi:hypothetical protein